MTTPKNVGETSIVNDNTDGIFPSRRNFWCWVGTTLLFTLAYLRFPVGDLSVALDPSWNGVLGFAREHRLQFGRDIAFTYGPLGFMSVASFMPLAITARMFLEILIAIFVSSGMCLLLWRTSVPWRILTLVVAILMLGTVHWAGDDLSTALGLFCWGTLAILDSGKRVRLYAACITAFAIFGGLTKFTALVTGGFTLAIVAGDLILRGRWQLVCAMLVAYPLGWLSGWLMLGQDLSSLYPFLSNWLAASGSYNAAMGLDGINWVAGFFVAATALATVIIRLRNAPLPETARAMQRRGLHLAWLCGLVFLLWKYGNVRADDEHISVFLAFMPAFALLMDAIPARPGVLRWWGRGTSLACAAMTIFMLQVLLPSFLKGECFVRAYRRVATNINSILQPSSYKSWRLEINRTNLVEAQLPKIREAVGHETVDVFGFFQNFAFFNDLNYHPRPVFQSYAVCSQRQMEMNERFYASSNAPAFVLFNLQAIDDRFPSLEDSFVFRSLLLNYEAVSSEKHFMVMRRNPGPMVAPQMTLLQSGETSPGTPIDMSHFGNTNLWMEIDVKPTLAGRATAFLYKPSPVRLQVWRGEGDSHRASFRAPTPMLSAGFLVSPLELDTTDVARLYSGMPVLRPTAVAVDCGTNAVSLWREKVTFRIYRIDKLAGH